MTETLFPPEYVEARARYRAFMDEHVYPNEAAIGREDEAGARALEELARARAGRAVGAAHAPEAGGTGLGFLYYACLNEEIGRSTTRSSSSAARRPTPATPRSCICSAPTSRRSASCGRSSRERCARSSR